LSDQGQLIKVATKRNRVSNKKRRTGKKASTDRDAAGRTHGICILSILSAAIVVYCNSFYGAPVLDDVFVVLKNPDTGKTLTLFDSYEDPDSTLSA